MTTKNRTKTSFFIFLAALTLCALSCTNHIEQISFQTGAGKAPVPEKPTPKVPAPETPDTAPKKNEGEKKQKLFVRLTNAVMRFETEVDVADLNISCAAKENEQAEYQKLYSEFLDYLEQSGLFLFHLDPAKDPTYVYKSDNENEVSKYKLKYLIDADKVDEDYPKIIQALEKFYAAVQKSMSEAEISYALYRELQKNVVYEVNSNSPYQRTAAGALLDGKGVCEDYSLVYQKLMNGMGIQTVCVDGKERTQYEGPTVAHTWNRIKLDGEWYNADATWDDNHSAQEQLRSHSLGKYFLTSDERFYTELNHPLIYKKFLPLPTAHDKRYENADYIFRNGEEKSDPFYYKGYWYYFSHGDMSIYRSLFNGSDKQVLYQKMYKENPDVFKPNFAKLHRMEFGENGIYFVDLDKNNALSYAVYSIAYDGSNLKKIGPTSSPNDPLKSENDKPLSEGGGIVSLKIELLLSKIKDCYYHGTEDYFIPESIERKNFITTAQKAEQLLRDTPEDTQTAAELYNALKNYRLHSSMEKTRGK